MKQFVVNQNELPKYLFFTGKGGVGKTSLACATAVKLASNSNVLLISTDPASNLEDVFNLNVTSESQKVAALPNLSIVNLNPYECTKIYREKILAQYHNQYPDYILKNIEEQLSGSCTMEIATFDAFVNYLVDEKITSDYDYIIFDTAPTGHTLRMLELPSAWNSFLKTNSNSCDTLGQLTGMEHKKAMYQQAVSILTNPKLTALILIAKPENDSLLEIERTSKELMKLGLKKQLIIINGYLTNPSDLHDNQDVILNQFQNWLSTYPVFFMPLKSYNLIGIDRLLHFFDPELILDNKAWINNESYLSIDAIAEDLKNSKKKILFVMGKGGVGKTTIAKMLANQLVEKNLRVHLTTTDFANHYDLIKNANPNLKISFLNPQSILKTYQTNFIAKVKDKVSVDDLEYLKEDLKSPCTQEMAIFAAFANLIEQSQDFDITIIDTAPTGHTLLLLDSTESYTKEVEKYNEDVDPAIKNLLPKIADPKLTEIVIVTLPQNTPVYEAQRLAEDLKRANLQPGWWVVNDCLSLSNNLADPILYKRAGLEFEWINKVKNISDNKMILLPHEFYNNF